MEQIKITDKLTLRQEALRMALERANAENNIHNALKLAKEYEEYLLGSAELPERDNGMEKYLLDMKDILFKQHNPWISADSEIRPAKDMPIVTKVSDSDNYFIGKYNETGWIIPNAPNGSSVVAWMPIPPFTQPTA